VGWALLIASLSGQRGALRIRFWRALRTSGAVALRDGVYLAPALPPLLRALEEQRAGVEAAGGSAYLLSLDRVSPSDETAFLALFDRSGEYAGLRRGIGQFVASLAGRTEADARLVLRQLKRDLSGLEAIDFFPSGAAGETASELRDAERALMRTFSPEEPQASGSEISRRERSDFRDRTWATRARPWVDRIASAWLIRRFIDPEARFLWLRVASDCPAHAVGFDFDGATFTHVGERVTFEVLIESFGLEDDAGLIRLGAVVHALDVGGERVPEAAGFEAMLLGARDRQPDDDSLLAHVSAILDDLYRAFALAPPP
jgi:hypothetical protein